MSSSGAMEQASYILIFWFIICYDSILFYVESLMYLMIKIKLHWHKKYGNFRKKNRIQKQNNNVGGNNKTILECQPIYLNELNPLRCFISDFLHLTNGWYRWRREDGEMFEGGVLEIVCGSCSVGWVLDWGMWIWTNWEREEGKWIVWGKMYVFSYSFLFNLEL
jgi:hypothetical protein